MGIATTRTELRAQAAFGLLQQAPVKFETNHNVCNAGVIFLLPALLAQGLLKSGENVYQSLRAGYYGLQHILLLLAFMALCRIKSAEQLKNCKPGELGKIMGLDRVPEAKRLRMKLQQIVAQGKAKEYNLQLAKEWMAEEQCVFFYVDGHVKIYHGKKAVLPKKYIARQKLCLAGMTEYWVNNEKGAPYFMVIGEVNEKLKDALLNQLVPILVKEAIHLPSQAVLDANPQLPRFTLVFDREAYDAKLFKELWEKYQIAVITYRKNVRDKWDEKEFKLLTTKVIEREITMNICERKTQVDGMEAREIRKLSDGGHQTSIITTNFLIDTATVAGKMFSRWSQENFFRYALQDFDLDRLAQYGVEQVNADQKVVNPLYRKTMYQLKKAKEKQSRLKAKQMKIVDKNLDQTIDHLKKTLDKQTKLHDSIRDWQKDIERLELERSQISSHITVKEMKEEEKYQSIKTESKLFMNTIKMIAFRGESAVANLLSPYYKKADNEIRMLVKEIIQSDADLLPDYEQKTLTIRIHTLSTPRANEAVSKICPLLNETHTIFPGTELRLIFETL
jgi:hypothetical protein